VCSSDLQVDSSVTRGYGGVGLGLSLVKELVGAVGGSVEVSSVPGEGTAFVVTIPIAPSTRADAETPAEREPRAAASL